MSRHHSSRPTAFALVALLALVPSFFTLGLHSDPESVGTPTLEATAVYMSEHRGQGDETHLHAEVGFESVLCLACFTSLRNQSLLVGEPVVTAMSDLGVSAARPSDQAPASAEAHAFSSRAPPRG